MTLQHLRTCVVGAGIAGLAVQLIDEAASPRHLPASIDVVPGMLRDLATLAIRPIIEHAFTQQDKPMLEAQQRRIGSADFWSLKPVLLSSDAGAVRTRRKLDALIAAEAGT